MTYTEWKKLPKTDWKTEPISSTCQVRDWSKSKSKQCDDPTVKAYPTMGNGWMSLCFKHGLRHTEAFKTDELIANGEKLEGL